MRLAHCPLFLILLFVLLLLNGCAQTSTSPSNQQNMMLGAEQLERYLPQLQGKRVGLIVNQTSVLYPNTPNSIHLVDALLQHHINVVSVFAPEHGFRGNQGAGEMIEDNIDTTTGLPIISLYGQTKAPTQAMLANIDVLVFDIQDVGVRFYTYISTMHYAMAAAAKYNVDMLILDRPNPNSQYVAGPILAPEFRSFVGMHPIPVVHGLTVGELALMIKGEHWIEHADNLTLNVISLTNYRKTDPYPLPIPPSPNLPNASSVRWYASLCLFEPTHISVGRGTALPFQMLGHPTLIWPDTSLTQIVPQKDPVAAPYPKWENTPLNALFIDDFEIRSYSVTGFDLRLLHYVFSLARAQGIDLITSESFFDKLAGSDTLRKALLQGESIEQIEARWQSGLSQYQSQRQPYLLYPE